MLTVVSPLYYQIAPPQRVTNFTEFVTLYMDIVPLRVAGYDANIPRRLTSTSSGYEVLNTYANTDYGAAVIAQMVSEKERFNGFKIKELSKESTRGASAGTTPGGGNMSLPQQFPKHTHYPTGGQLIDPVAVIHHEFYHTVLRYGFVDKDILLDDEREAVLFAENPARLANESFNGILLEPRYSYYRKELEAIINIMTGEYKHGQHTVHKHDIRKLVGLKDPGALKDLGAL